MLTSSSGCSRQAIIEHEAINPLGPPIMGGKRRGLGDTPKPSAGAFSCTSSWPNGLALSLITGKPCLTRATSRGVQRGAAPLRFFLSPKIGGQGVDVIAGRGAEGGFDWCLLGGRAGLPQFIVIWGTPPVPPAGGFLLHLRLQD